MRNHRSILRFYMSFPGCLTMIGVVCLTQGIGLLATDWKVSVGILFPVTIALWLISWRLYTKAVLKSLQDATSEPNVGAPGMEPEVDMDHPPSPSTVGGSKVRRRVISNMSKDFDGEMEGIDKKAFLDKMLSGVEQVKLGVFSRLAHRYVAKMGREEAGLLAGAITNELFSNVPSNPKGQSFLESNRDLVEKEIANLRDDEEICNAVTQAARVQAIIFSYNKTTNAKKEALDSLWESFLEASRKRDLVEKETVYEAMRDVFSSYSKTTTAQEEPTYSLLKLLYLGILIPGGEIPLPDTFLSMSYEFYTRQRMQ